MFLIYLLLGALAFLNSFNVEIETQAPKIPEASSQAEQAEGEVLAEVAGISIADLEAPFSKTGQAQLPNPMHAFSSFKAAYGGNTYIYVLGGQGNRPLYNTVYRTLINPTTGNLGTFSKTGLTQLPKGTETHALVLATINSKNYIYMIGGDGDKTVYRSTIDSSTGEMGPWTLKGQAELPIGLDTHMPAVAKVGTKTYVYIMGGIGESGNDVRKTVYRALIDPITGNMGTFSTAGQAQLPQATYWGRSTQLVINGETNVYVIGGSNYGTRYNTVYKATVNPTTGNMGTFSTAGQGQLPIKIEAMHVHIASINGTNYLYVVGGDTGRTSSTAYKAPIDSSGNIGTFTTLRNSTLKTDEGGVFTHVIGGKIYMYLLRGSDDNNTTDVMRSIVSGSAITGSNKKIVASEDSYARKDQPNAKYGGSVTLRVDADPELISYLKFDLTSLSNKVIDKAVLKLKVDGNANSGSPLSKGVAVRSLENITWTEATLNYSNRPTSTNSIASITGAKKPGDLIEVDVTPYINQKPGKKVSLSLTNYGTDGIWLSSKDASSGKPTLEISYH
ncbi:MAG: hypothetical protein ACD_37C00089G0005 [uncultured bacterium]|nr:MAG: hypothetical protein ACD_37C00089G0005 [uncultured bacterium]